MRHLAMTGIDTVAMISRIFFGEAIRATPPSARICAGTRSRAITATAPAFSAIEACSAFVTSIITPPFNISARPVFRRRLVELPLFCDMRGLFSAGFGLWLSGSGEAVAILQRVRNLRYPRRVHAKDQRQKRRTGVSDPNGLSRSMAISSHMGYLSTYLANIFAGSMAMKVPRLRA